jgi:hypothetical protein
VELDKGYENNKSKDGLDWLIQHQRNGFKRLIKHHKDMYDWFIKSYKNSRKTS